MRKRGHDGSKRPSLPDDHEEHSHDGEEDEPELDGVVDQQTLEKVNHHIMFVCLSSKNLNCQPQDSLN